MICDGLIVSKKYKYQNYSDCFIDKISFIML